MTQTSTQEDTTSKGAVAGLFFGCLALLLLLVSVWRIAFETDGTVRVVTTLLTVILFAQLVVHATGRLSPEQRVANGTATLGVAGILLGLQPGWEIAAAVAAAALALLSVRRSWTGWMTLELTWPWARKTPRKVVDQNGNGEAKLN